MESSSGRTLTSFGPDSSDAPATSTETSRSTRTGTTIDDQDVDNAPFTATALDFAYRAFAARDAVNVSVPPLYTNAQAVDSASFAGQGATFSVYRRRIPQRKFKTKVNMGGWSIEVEEPLKLPEVVAYKVAMIDFTEIGEAADHASRRAINAAVMELHLSAHPPILKHPNLVDFFGLAWGSNPFHTSHKLPALIVEFAECGSLSDLQRRECLNLEMRRKLCLDVCQGLYMLHSCGVVHGDVKADNVLIFPDAKQKYVAKVSDFGFSFITSAREDGLRLGGTRPWKAPEAKEAIKVSDAKYTDVYSLALLIWCTFAHGQNIFRLLIDPAKQGEDFYAEAERIKETGQLAARTGLEDWYLKALTSSSYGDQAQIMAYLASAPQRIQNLMSQPDNIMGAVSGMEELLCAIPPMFTGALAQAQQQLIAIIQQSGLYSAMQQAVAIGLSTDPSQRSLANIMVALGHSGSFPATESDLALEPRLTHKFTWSNWPLMDPSVQKYLTTTYINRSEDDTEKSMINPPEAFLLASLYINGYGVDRDEVKATRWLAAAWRAKHPLAGAYTYRIARAIDAKLGNPAQVEELLELMAIRGSRIALQDLAALSPSRYDRTKKTVRDVLAGTGADFFFQKNMLHGFNHGSWMMTFSNIPILLQNFGRLNRVADYTANKRGDRILHIAASCGQTEAIEALLGRFDVLQVNQLNDQGETPLLCACRAGQKGTVLWLTEHGADASVAANNGEAPLHWLISFDNEDVYTVGKALIRAGAKVTAKTATFVAHHADFPTTLVSDRLPQGFPIGWATHCDRPDIVEFLMTNMPDPLICGESWPRANSALEIAASQQRAKCLRIMIETMEKFNLEEGAAKYRGYPTSGLLFQAVSGCSLFDMILYHGADYAPELRATLDFIVARANKVAAANGYGGLNQTLLYYAVSMARDEAVEYILEHATDAMKRGDDYDEEVLSSQDVGAFKPTDIHRPCGAEMRTPLLEGVRWNRPALVNLLIRHGALATTAAKNPFSGVPSSWTALHVLAHSGHDDPRLVQTLVDGGVSVDGVIPDTNHATALAAPTEPPLLVALQTDSFRVADAIVGLGADVNAVAPAAGHLLLSRPTTPLGHIIASNARNSIARLRWLLQLGPTASMSTSTVDPVVEPSRRWTALHRAAVAHGDVYFRPGEPDGTPQAFNWDQVDWAANREMLVELLTKFASPGSSGNSLSDTANETSEPTNEDSDPSSKPSRDPNPSTTDLVNAKETSAGFTPLHLAVMAGNEAAVELLLQHGARGDIPAAGDGTGRTAAQMARDMAGTGGTRGEVAARGRCNVLLTVGTDALNV